MLANFLSKSKPINFVVLLSLFAFFYLATVFSSVSIDVFTLKVFLKYIGIFILFVGAFFFYLFIVNKNRLTFDNSYAAYFFILFLIFLLPNLLNFKTLFLLFIHLFLLRKIYSLKSLKNGVKKVFDAGFWLGISFLIAPFSVFYIVLIYMGVFLHHKKITINTFLSPIIGFITPIIIYFTYCFGFDKIESFTQIFYFDDVSNFYANIAYDTTIWFVVIVLLLTLISLFLKTPVVASVNNSFKKNWFLLITNIFIAIIYASVITDTKEVELLFLCIPSSIIIANGLEAIKSKLLLNSVLLVVLIGVFVHQFLL